MRYTDKLTGFEVKPPDFERLAEMLNVAVMESNRGMA
jgi:hypothetical protein